MCETCWAKHDRPAHTSPEIERAVELMADIYDENPVGGPLHAALDDWNVEADEMIRPFYRRGDPDDEGYSDEFWAAVDKIVPLLRSMPVRDRVAALAHSCGYTEEVPTA